MSGKPFAPTAVDEHIGQRVQLRRMMMGLSQKDLAKIWFELSMALDTPVSFFFQGLPGNLPEPTRSGRVIRVSEPQADDPLAKNESLELIKLYWKLPDDQRRMVMKMVKSLNGIES